MAPILTNGSSKSSSPKLETDFIYEDRQHFPQLLENMDKLRRHRQFCDVILQVGNQQDIHEYYAHRAVLASASPYLLEMFSADSSGVSSAVQQYKLMNGNYDTEAFGYLIDFAYSSRLEIPKEKVKNVYAVANRLKMTSVAYECGKFLASTLTPETALGVRAVPGVMVDPLLLNAVDAYIRQNIAEVTKSKSIESLPKIQIDFLQNNDEERAAINEKHLVNMVLDWIQHSYETDDQNITLICSKMHMLYLNKNDKKLHDCSDMQGDNSGIENSELIKDYKQMSRRLSFPSKNGQNGSQQTPRPANGHSHTNSTQAPSKPRQFLFTRSDSESSISSLVDEDESDWKVLATNLNGEHTILGLVTIAGKLCCLTIKLRLNSASSSPSNSRNHSIEKPNECYIIAPMSCSRCACGTAAIKDKLLVCGGYDRGECLKSVEVYDANLNKWEFLRPMLVPRGRFDITAMNDKIYAVGGCDGQNELCSVEEFNPKTSSWKQLPNCPVARSNAG